MTRADFHIHSEHSPDSLLPVKSLVRRCKERGLGLIAVTDHNSIDGALRAREIADFPVIVGEEVTTADGELTGLFLTNPVPPGLSALETAKRIKDQGALVSIPHPFDVFRRNVITRRALSEVIKEADIVEGFNARNTLASANDRAKNLAKDAGLPVTAVSDSHTVIEIGRTYTEVQAKEITPKCLMLALADAKLVEYPVNPLIHLLTSAAKVRKKLLWSKLTE